MFFDVMLFSRSLVGFHGVPRYFHSFSGLLVGFRGFSRFLVGFPDFQGIFMVASRSLNFKL